MASENGGNPFGWSPCPEGGADGALGRRIRSGVDAIRPLRWQTGTALLLPPIGATMRPLDERELQAEAGAHLPCAATAPSLLLLVPASGLVTEKSRPSAARNRRPRQLPAMGRASLARPFRRSRRERSTGLARASQKEKLKDGENYETSRADKHVAKKKVQLARAPVACQTATSRIGAWPETQ